MTFFSKFCVVLFCVMQFNGIGYASTLDAKSLKLAGGKFTPRLYADLQYTDNLLDTPNNEVSSWISHIVPSFELKHQKNKDQYLLQYQLTNVLNFASSDDNYTNHQLNAVANIDLQTRHRLQFKGGYGFLNEERGDGYSIGNGFRLQEPTRYDVFDASAIYSYGAQNAQANIDVKLSFEDIRWDDFKLVDEPSTVEDLNQNAERDYLNSRLASTFYYQTGAYTKATFTAGVDEFDYTNENHELPSLDSNGSFAFLGVEWQGTALTSGFFRLGYEYKHYDASQRDSISGLRWQVGVIWEPLTYSTVNFSTYRSTEETKGQGSYIENTTLELSWSHRWLERFSTEFAIAFEDDEYGETKRKDDNSGISATLNYHMQRNLELAFTIVRTERSSNFDSVEYVGNSFELAVNASF